MSIAIKGLRELVGIDSGAIELAQAGFGIYSHSVAGPNGKEFDFTDTSASGGLAQLGLSYDKPEEIIVVAIILLDQGNGTSGFVTARYADKNINTVASDDLSINANRVYSHSVSSSAGYVSLGGGEIIHGRFDKVSVYENTAGSDEWKFIFARR